MITEKDIPPTYTLIKMGRTTIVCKDAYRTVLMEMGIGDPKRFSNGFSEPSERYQGRGAVRTMTIPGASRERMVIRHYRRGGKIQKFSADIYWGSSRPLLELNIGYQALEKGIPTAEIVAACHSQVLWFFHRGDLVSKEIANGIDLIAYLKTLPVPLTREKILQKRAIIEAVGKAVRKMHDAGIVHGDLHLKNIILQLNESPEIKSYIIDFDKSKATATSGDHKRYQNLMRLNRSVERYRRQGFPITRTDVLRFLLAYSHDPADSTCLLGELSRRYKWHMRYHRLGQTLLRWF